MQVQIGSELQPSVGVGNGERTLDVVGNGLAGSVGEIVERQDDDVVAYADTAVFPAVASEGWFAHDYHLLVLTL